MDFDIKDIMRSILERESKAILDIPVTDDYEKAVGLIVEHVKGRGGKLVASGMGKAGQIAMNIATTFASTASRQYRCTPPRPSMATWVFFSPTM